MLQKNLTMVYQTKQITCCFIILLLFFIKAPIIATHVVISIINIITLFNEIYFLVLINASGLKSPKNAKPTEKTNRGGYIRKNLNKFDLCLNPQIKIMNKKTIKKKIKRCKWNCTGAEPGPKKRNMDRKNK